MFMHNLSSMRHRDPHWSARVKHVFLIFLYLVWTRVYACLYENPKLAFTFQTPIVKVYSTVPSVVLSLRSAIFLAQVSHSKSWTRKLRCVRIVKVTQQNFWSGWAGSARQKLVQTQKNHKITNNTIKSRIDSLPRGEMLWSYFYLLCEFCEWMKFSSR